MDWSCATVAEATVIGRALRSGKIRFARLYQATFTTYFI
jgi:hypothetical protein